MLGFICAVIAGFAAPYVEEPLVQPLARALRGKIDIEPSETRLVGFILTMLIAGIAAELLNSGSAFWVILGGALGYFALRIVAAVKALIDQQTAK